MLRRRLIALAASCGIALSGLVGLSTPAMALESTLLSPSTVEPGSVNAVTITGNDYRIEYSVYQFQFEGFSGLTSCANVTITTSPAQGSAGVGNVTCSIPASNQIKLVFADAGGAPYTFGSVTVAIAASAGLTAPSTPGSYGIIVRDWNNDVIPGISGTICVGYCTTPPAPVDTLDFDGNGGSCSPDKIAGFRTTWGNALTADKCSNGDKYLVGFSTSATNAEGSVFVAPGGAVYFGGSNRLYAVWASKAPPAAPQNVKATSGWHSVTVSWTPPVGDLVLPIANYLVSANPGGQVCITRLTDPNMLECTFKGLALGAKYTFTVQALNAMGWGERSVESNAVAQMDLKIDKAERAKAPLFALFGTTVKVDGSAPGFAAGTPITPQWKLGNGSWVSATGNLPRVDAKGRVSWSKKFESSKNKTPIQVRLSDGTNVSDSLLVPVGSSVGLPTAPRDLKVESTVNGVKLSWNPPAHDGGSPVKYYDVQAGQGMHYKVPGTRTSYTWPQSAGFTSGTTYPFTVFAQTARGDSPVAKTQAKVINYTSSITEIERDTWGWDGDHLTVKFLADGFKPGTKFTVQAALKKSGPWVTVAGTQSADSSTSYTWKGDLTNEVRRKNVYVRVDGPGGPTKLWEARAGYANGRAVD